MVHMMFNSYLNSKETKPMKLQPFRLRGPPTSQTTGGLMDAFCRMKSYNLQPECGYYPWNYEQKCTPEISNDWLESMQLFFLEGDRATGLFSEASKAVRFMNSAGRDWRCQENSPLPDGIVLQVTFWTLSSETLKRMPWLLRDKLNRTSLNTLIDSPLTVFDNVDSHAAPDHEFNILWAKDDTPQMPCISIRKAILGWLKIVPQMANLE